MSRETENMTILTGQKMICANMNRSWRTIEKWIDRKNFPARKIDGVCESDTELINEWRRGEIGGNNQ